MDAFLLAAGLGTRLKPFTDRYPKCLAPVKQVPLLYLWIKKLQNAEFIDKIFINLHYKKEEVRAMLREAKYDSRKVILVEEERLLGTGGSIKNMLSLSSADNFFIIHADNYSEAELDIMQRMFEKRKKQDKRIEATVLGFGSKDYESCGFMMTDETSVLRNFIEKPVREVQGVANAAIFACTRDLLKELVVDNESFDFSAECLPKMTGRAVVYETGKLHIDIGSMERLIQANKSSTANIDDVALKGDWYENYKSQVRSFLL